MYNLVANIMLDQVICVSGQLKISDGRSRIIFTDEFFWPDVPMTFRPNHAADRVSAMCISDIHIGSKEFVRPLWDRLVEFLNGRIGGERQQQLAGEVKYLLIAGDAVDGIGVYPSQEANLTAGLDDIYAQYAVLQEMLQGVPDYIQIIYIPGNHEPVRNAIPCPSVPKKFVGDIQSNLNVLCLGNPSTVSVHGVKTLMFHGDSFIDFSMNVPGVDVNHPDTAMVECLRGRHLAPSFGKKTELAPGPLDWLVVDEVPDIFHTGHLHINGFGRYRNVTCIGSGCFESQTDFMKSLGIVPTPGKPFIVRLYEPDLAVTQIDLQDIS
jgi:DNA polymerase II small subunit